MWASLFVCWECTLKYNSLRKLEMLLLDSVRLSLLTRKEEKQFMSSTPDSFHSEMLRLLPAFWIPDLRFTPSGMT